VNRDQQASAAFVGFSFTDDFELIFCTSNTTRKYANITANPQVAAVVGGQERITVQFEGIAEELAGDQAATYKERYFSKNPAARRFARDTTNRCFRIRPRWLRYSDYTQGPPEIFELKFDDVK
jgi:uncharacterized protein YhbP (UPF0306 family)